MGYASAMAWVLFVIIMVVTFIQIRVTQRFVYYEAETR
jgi:multiple sugar transport system permease protein